MVKVKRERTADCVVAGFRLLVDRPLPSSLLVGLFDELLVFTAPDLAARIERHGDLFAALR
jgi:hypothetical protein